MYRQYAGYTVDAWRCRALRAGIMEGLQIRALKIDIDTSSQPNALLSRSDAYYEAPRPTHRCHRLVETLESSAHIKLFKAPHISGPLMMHSMALHCCSVLVFEWEALPTRTNTQGCEPMFTASVASHLQKPDQHQWYTFRVHCQCLRKLAISLADDSSSARLHRIARVSKNKPRMRYLLLVPGVLLTPRQRDIYPWLRV
ncbi:hypothetical protein PLICRDRAFT_513542 [Plicaturopsis crispa FD-325 SS-3]|nr:hypothetical protein PLICRDRAFT_513542 [Plicaturopsis crispa FD-325 SS-3]